MDDIHEIHDNPIGAKTDSHTIFSVINDRCSIMSDLCRGQAFYKAANTSGHSRGVAASFKEHNPVALHVHCLVHCLNLCLEDAGEKM